MIKHFVTKPEDARVTHGVAQLKSGVWITVMPLQDAYEPLLARMTYNGAKKAAEALGGRLPTRAEVAGDMVSQGHIIKPCLLPYDSSMVTREAAELHDETVRARLKATNWDSKKPVMNAGKYWVDGAAPGNVRICGWWDGSKLIQQGTTDIEAHKGGADSHHDYATTTMVVWDEKPQLEGPWFGRRIVDRLKSLTSAVTLKLAPTNSDTALADKILAIAHHEKATVWEATGNNDGAVKKYFLADAIVAACTRLLNGKELKTGWAKGWEWCAASASWVIHHACAALGLKPGVGRRIAVWELVRDAKELGTFEPATATPKPGWLVFFSRGSGNPLKAGQQGHVGIVLEPPKAGTIKSIDGNNGVAWGIAERSMSRVVGYARPTAD